MASGRRFLDALFTSTSAVCVTGLVVLDTGTYWSTFGQVVILLLVQLGGFGFMTSSTLLLFLMRPEATLRERTLLRSRSVVAALAGPAASTQGHLVHARRRGCRRRHSQHRVYA